MLGPAGVQLHFADLQDGIVDLSDTTPPATIRRSVGILARMAQLLELPVILSAAPRPGGPAVVEEAAVPQAPVFVRDGPCAWDDTPTRRALTAQPRKHLALCGVTSEIVVLHTALDALAAGYEVSVLLDACGGLSSRTEQAAFRQIELAGGRVIGVAGFATDLVRDFTTPVGREVITALHGLVQEPVVEGARYPLDRDRRVVDYSGPPVASHRGQRHGSAVGVRGCGSPGAATTSRTGPHSPTLRPCASTR
ncbi:isochorismatase family protein [Streptomyces sp. Q6]|uniref:Isochorismatase family protein n=1 Tax=Streptomyces citrinus TaxID=3118173 RepID=A0ACD5AGW6_9ACTN